MDGITPTHFSAAGAHAKVLPDNQRAPAPDNSSKGESMSNHISALRAKHDQFERGLIAELSRPLPDEQRVKLRLKDRIAKLTPYPPIRQ